MKSHKTIVITGFMGCGKTELARRLAKVLDWRMIDLDELITKREAKTPARLIAEDGEEFFRARETDALQSVLKEASASVIALGGGAWIETLNRDLIRKSGAISVWLDAPFEVCWQRIDTSGDDRPLGKTLRQAKQLYDRRLPVYALSDLRLHFFPDESIEELAIRVAGELSKQTLI